MDRRGHCHITDQVAWREYVSLCCYKLLRKRVQANSFIQLILPISVHHRIHLVPSSHRRASQCIGSTNDCANSRLSCPDCLVSCCRSQYSWWLWCPSQSRGYRCLPIARLLHFNWLSLLYQLGMCFLFLPNYVSIS